MKKLLLAALLLITGGAFAQSKFNGQEFSLNGFRSHSIGLEYRYHAVSVHAGYYITAFKAGETTEFFKVGITT
ncbi:hypothetical protein [Mucilaginibacter pedocola]|uniref:hypothetical protein n=1 Tax=Mucilaginibacter pedocola TaxID=1792845 RepID=UPI00192E74AD|nr:hypothetical protein [Mucilaginibacter pedocola]